MFFLINLLFITLVVASPVVDNGNNTSQEIITASKDNCLFDIIKNSGTQRLSCSCQVDNDDAQKIREDYKNTPGIGIYKFHPVATTFNEARKICVEEGGQLAVINSAAEERVCIIL